MEEKNENTGVVEENPKTSKKKAGNAVAGIFIFLLIVSVGLGVYLILTKSASTESRVVYYTENDVRQYLITSDRDELIAETDIPDVSDDGYYYESNTSDQVQYTPNYEYVFFMDNLDSSYYGDGTYSELWCMGLKEQTDARKAELIADHVYQYDVISDTQVLIYSDSSRLSCYDMETGKTEKLGTGVQEYYLDEEKTRVFWTNGSGNGYLKNLTGDGKNEKKEKVTSDAGSVIYVSPDLEIIYYTSEDYDSSYVYGAYYDYDYDSYCYTLRRLDHLSEETVVDENVGAECAVEPGSGNVYYLKNGVTRNLAYYISNPELPWAEDEAETTEAIEMTEATEETEIAEDAEATEETETTEEAETTEAEYRFDSDYVDYEDYDDGENWESYLEEETGSTESELWYYDGKSRMVLAGVTKINMELYGKDKAEKDYLIVVTADSSKLEKKVKVDYSGREDMDLYDLYYDVCDQISAETSKNEVLQLVSGENTFAIPIENPDDYVQYSGYASYLACVDTDTDTLYYINNASEYGTGDLMRAAIGEMEIEKPVTVWDREASTPLDVKDGEPIYALSGDYGYGYSCPLYIGDEEIDKNVSEFYVRDDGIVVLYDTYSDDVDYTGTLGIYRDGSIKDIDDDVHSVQVFSDGHITYIKDYDSESGTGELYIWTAENGSRLIAGDVRGSASGDVE